MFTLEQKAQYDTFGFLVMKRYFSPDEMAWIMPEFDELLAGDRNGEPFDGKERHSLLRFIEMRPSLLRLVEDDRVFEAVGDLLGADFIFMASEGNLMVGDSQWHPDGYRPNIHPDGWQLGLERIAVTFYLDPISRDTGCLRVIPGSHRPPLYESLKRILAYREDPMYDVLEPLLNQRTDPREPAFGVAPEDLPSVALESQPGDVIFWNSNLWHASFGGRPGRRMFRIAFCENPKKPEQIGLLKFSYQRIMENKRKLAPNCQTDHEPAFLESDRPRIRHLASRLVELNMA